MLDFIGFSFINGEGFTLFIPLFTADGRFEVDLRIDTVGAVMGNSTNRGTEGAI
jgi:hypothetical protein